MTQFVIIVIFVVFSVLRILGQQAQQNARKGQQARGVPERQRRRVKNDIEAFLQEVKSGGAQQPAQAAPRRPQERRTRPRSRRPPQPSPPQQRQSASRKGRALGSGVSEHVETYINQHVSEHMDSDVDETVEVHIVDSVTDHLGDRESEMPQATASSGERKSGAAAELRKLLRTPGGVRQAVLLNEILQPRSRARRGRQ